MRYSMILLELVSQKHKLLSLDYNTFKKENELYEIFILLSVKIAQCFFQEKYHQVVEEGKHLFNLFLIRRMSSSLEKWSF